IKQALTTPSPLAGEGRGEGAKPHPETTRKTDMACGCGGGNGGQGGCGGQQPVIDTNPAVHEVVPEPIPTADEPEADAEEVPELIATSAQEWPRVKVNGVAIAPEAIALELQYHPADSRNEAV